MGWVPAGSLTLLLEIQPAVSSHSADSDCAILNKVVEPPPTTRWALASKP